MRTIIRFQLGVDNRLDLIEEATTAREAVAAYLAKANLGRLLPTVQRLAALAPLTGSQ